MSTWFDEAPSPSHCLVTLRVHTVISCLSMQSNLKSVSNHVELECYPVLHKQLHCSEKLKWDSVRSSEIIFTRKKYSLLIYLLVIKADKIIIMHLRINGLMTLQIVLFSPIQTKQLFILVKRQYHIVTHIDL